MTPSELSAIRVECAEARGWTPQYKHQDPSIQVWKKPGTTGENAIRDYDIDTTLPNYPIDNNAALSLATALADEGWEIDMMLRPGGWEASLWKNGQEYIAETAPTFALALCLAFLKTHRSNKD